MIYSGRSSTNSGDATRSRTQYNDPNRFIRGAGGSGLQSKAKEQVALAEAQKQRYNAIRETEKKSQSMASYDTDVAEHEAALEAWKERRRLKQEKQKAELQQLDSGSDRQSDTSPTDLQTSRKISDIDNN